jgi:hypothetical protein
MMDWFRKFMAGRSGGDQFSVFLFIASMVLTLTGQFSGIEMLVSLSYVPLLFGIYRIFSKDVNKRRLENYKFAMFISPLYGKFKKIQTRRTDQKTHQYFKCTNCKTMMRVPKGKGKIMVTCPKCTTKVLKQT